MIKRSIIAFCVASSIASPAVADISNIEDYLVGEDGLQLASEIKELRHNLQMQVRESGFLSDHVGRCPVSSEPLSTETYQLLISGNPEDRQRFFAVYGDYLGLPMPFDPQNGYHQDVAFARHNVHQAPMWVRDDISENDLNAIAAVMLEIAHSHIAQQSDFWPPELGDFALDDLVTIRNLGDEELSHYVSETLMPRAELTAERLRDQLDVCATRNDAEATRRSKQYFNGPL